MDTFWTDVPELQKLLDAGKNFTDYPLQLEQDRGLLRVWGVGEGHEFYDGTPAPDSPDSFADADAPSPGSTKEGLWGAGYQPTNYSSPSTLSSDSPRSHTYPGGLGPDGNPDFILEAIPFIKGLWPLTPELGDEIISEVHHLVLRGKT